MPNPNVFDLDYQVSDGFYMTTFRQVNYGLYQNGGDRID